MDIEGIKELSKELMMSFKEAELTKFSLKCEAFELELGKEVNVMTIPQTVYMEANSQGLQEVHSVGASLTTAHSEGFMNHNEDKVHTGSDLSSKKVIKAPLVGTFYNAEGPDAKPFVEVGSYVHKGDVVCIIEAMKLMNEVEAEEDGEVVQILVNNEDMVEYNQPLIVLR